MLRTTIFVLIALATSCGGTVARDGGVLEEPDAAVAPPLTSHCNAYQNHGSCCAAGCRWFNPTDESLGTPPRCISLEQDCVYDAECPTGTECLVDETSGNGGCSYGYDIDAVGVCEP